MRLIAIPFVLLAAAPCAWAQTVKPKATDPLAAVRTHLKQMTNRAHLHVVVQPTPARQPLDPAQDAHRPISYTPVSYHPLKQGH